MRPTKGPCGPDLVDVTLSRRALDPSVPGKVGSAIAQAFARQGIEVTVAGRRPPEVLAPLAAQIGPTVVTRPMADALEADILLLAVPFGAHREVAQTAKSWQGKLVIDAMNAFGVPPEELGGLPSTAAVAAAMPGATLVRAFNHLPAETLANQVDLEATAHGGDGACSSPATTMRQAPRLPASSTGWALRPSSWGSSTRAACSFRRGAAPGVGSSSKHDLVNAPGMTAHR